MRWVPARSYGSKRPVRCNLPFHDAPRPRRTYLENHAGGDDGGDTQFHQSTPVTGQHHTQPVQRIRGVGGDNAVQRHLTHDQENQQGQLRESSTFQAVIHTTERNHTPVHISFWLKGTLVSGAATSGRRGVKGLIRSRNRTIRGNQYTQTN